MKDFLKDSKWLIFSILVVFIFWFAPKATDYFEKIEQKANDELFENFIDEASKIDISSFENTSALLCRLDGLHPIRLIITNVLSEEGNKEIKSIKYLEPIDDRLSKTYKYQIKSIPSFGSRYDIRYELRPKVIIFKWFWVDTEDFEKAFESNASLNRENLILTIKNTDFGYEGNAKCSIETVEAFEAYMNKHNSSLIEKNIL